MNSQKATDGIVERADAAEVILRTTDGAMRVLPAWLASEDVRAGDRLLLICNTVERGAARRPAREEGD